MNEEKFLLESALLPVHLITRVVECEGCNMAPCAKTFAVLPDGSEVMLVQANLQGDFEVSDAAKVSLVSGLLLATLTQAKGAVEPAVSADDIMRKAYGLEGE